MKLYNFIHIPQEIWKFLEEFIIDEPEKLWYNKFSQYKIVEKRAFMKLIGKSHNLSGKRLKNRSNFCIMKIGQGNLSSTAVLACESEVIYVKHYRNQKHHKGI